MACRGDAEVSRSTTDEMKRGCLNRQPLFISADWGYWITVRVKFAVTEVELDEPAAA